MREIAEFIALLSCALFTGAAVYITFVEHPARMQCGVELAVSEFAPSYRRATIMQTSCAVLGLLSSVVAWRDGASFWWVVGGVLLGSVIPFTLIVILPTNKRLLSVTLDKRSIEAERLLARWVSNCTLYAACSADWRCCFSCTWCWLGNLFSVTRRFLVGKSAIITRDPTKGPCPAKGRPSAAPTLVAMMLSPTLSQRARKDGVPGVK